MRPNLVLLALGVGMACASTASAQSILAGEHADFTRIAIRVGDGEVPSLRSDDETIRVQGAVGVRSGDLDAALQKLGKTRVDRIKVNPDGVEIALNCDCEAETFDYRGYLVIDIAEKGAIEVVTRSPHPTSPFEAWKIPEATIFASCSIGTWCENLMSIVPNEDTDDYCTFAPGILVNMTEVQGADTPETESLRHYLDKGWRDEAALLVAELQKSATETKLIKLSEDAEAPACEASASAPVWTNDALSEPLWEPSPPEKPYETAPEQVVDHAKTEIETPAIEPVRNIGDIHSRARSFLQSYKAALE